MANDQEYRTLSFIKQTQDGLDFIEYLEKLSKKNYNEFLRCDKDKSEVHKGIAIALDNLIKLFEHCDNKEKQHEYDYSIF